MKRVILDAQLLVLLTVGRVNRSSVETHKRTRNFEPGDYEILTSFLINFDEIALCPNVATEASNLLDPKNDGDLRFAAGLAAIVSSFSETYVPTAAAAARPEYGWLGLTDAVLSAMTETGAPLLTRDTGLYTAVLSAGGLALHFDYLRAGVYGGT